MILRNIFKRDALKNWRVAIGPSTRSDLLTLGTFVATTVRASGSCRGKRSQISRPNQGKTSSRKSHQVNSKNGILSVTTHLYTSCSAVHFIPYRAIPRQPTNYDFIKAKQQRYSSSPSHKTIYSSRHPPPTTANK